jgi:SAM-dependent methyltransferase
VLKELSGITVADTRRKPLVQVQAARTQQETAPRRMDLLERWRLRVVLPFVRGRLLDLACGYNNLRRTHGFGVGADVFPWEGIDVRIGDAAQLPFRDGSFDTVSVVAALNHIPNREAALLAVMRVLRPGGLFLATMIGPWTGRIAHLCFRQDETRRGGMRRGEVDGIRPSAMRALLREAGFELVREVPFQLGLNRLYIAKKPDHGSARVPPSRAGAPSGSRHAAHD